MSHGEIFGWKTGRNLFLYSDPSVLHLIITVMEIIMGRGLSNSSEVLSCRPLGTCLGYIMYPTHCQQQQQMQVSHLHYLSFSSLCGRQNDTA